MLRSTYPPENNALGDLLPTNTISGLVLSELFVRAIPKLLLSRHQQNNYTEKSTLCFFVVGYIQMQNNENDINK